MRLRVSLVVAVRVLEREGGREGGSRERWREKEAL